MKVTLLDGGMGQELIARTGKATTLWSVQALLSDHDLVRQVHADFFSAGAEIATANTYSILPDRLIPHGLQDRLEELIKLACQQAVSARDAHGSGLIAGSLGPIGFSYQPHKCPPAADAAEVYRRVCKAQRPYVDLFIAETMASVDQVRGALLGMSDWGIPNWIALTVDDDDGRLLRSGEPLEEVLPLLEEFEVDAVLLNCSVPEAITQGIPVLAQSAHVVGAYANGFTAINEAFNSTDATVELLETRKDLDAAAYADFAAQWISDGATIIGGCCEVGPSHIAHLKQRFC